ncbi:hypothetical protein J7438_25420, partial [Thalassotalea sp. G20_0]|uniref:hypothetical protein n=1 Tax=Thalassotalea sp. G20_0 TaxID=2821093 RepID=UPI001ADC586B
NCICGLMVWRMSETTACQWKSSMIKLGHRLLFSRADGFSDKHQIAEKNNIWKKYQAIMQGIAVQSGERFTQ